MASPTGLSAFVSSPTQPRTQPHQPAHQHYHGAAFCHRLLGSDERPISDQ